MRPEIAEAEVVQKALTEATQWLVTGIATDLASWCNEVDDEETVKVSSPIEGVFALWWEAVKYAHRLHENDPFLDLQCQHTVKIGTASYRLDFAVITSDADLLWDAHKLSVGPEPQLAVELDGHDFHERTKAQVEHRNQRDRDLQIAGWKVFHFSGSEVVKAGLQCATEVMEHADREFTQFRRRVRAAKIRASHNA